MTEDIFVCDLNSLDERTLHESIRAFLRLENSLDERPAEGHRLDFKREWGDSALKAVCSLANAFGGLLIVGVVDEGGKPANLGGFDEKGQGETKVRISSSIETNITPAPVFQIGVCSIGKSPGKVAAVISVSESPEICMLTKKDVSNPVYVRSADGCLPADAWHLRRLIEKERRFLASDFRYAEREESAYREMDRAITASESRPDFKPPSTWFRVSVLPRNHPRVVLDRKVEGNVLKEIRNTFWHHDELLANRESLRGANFVVVRVRHQGSGHQRCWYASSAGDIAFQSDVSWDRRGEKVWSLYDVTSDMLHVLRLAHRWWQGAGYFGSFRPSADLCVEGHRVFTDTSFKPCFYDRVVGPVDWIGIDSRAVTLGLETAPRSIIRPSFEFEFAGQPGALQTTTVQVTNDLLRGLGHSIDRDLFTMAVGQMR